MRLLHAFTILLLFCLLQDTHSQLECRACIRNIMYTSFVCWRLVLGVNSSHLFTSFVCCFSTQQIFSHSQFEHCFRVRCARACVLRLNWYWLSSSFHHYCVNVSIQTEGDACDLLFAYFARMNPKNFTLLQHELWAEATAAIVGRSSIIETLTHNTITSHHISPSVQLLIHMREKSSHSSVAVAKKKLFQICTSNSKCRWSAQAQKNESAKNQREWERKWE